MYFIKLRFKYKFSTTKEELLFEIQIRPVNFY